MMQTIYTTQLLLPMVITFIIGFMFGALAIGLYARYKIKKIIRFYEGGV